MFNSISLVDAVTSAVLFFIFAYVLVRLVSYAFYKSKYEAFKDGTKEKEQSKPQEQKKQGSS